MNRKTYYIVFGIQLFILLLSNIEICTSQVSYGGKPRHANMLKNSTFSVENIVFVEDLSVNKIREEVNGLPDYCPDCKSKFIYGKEIDLGISYFEKADSIKVSDGTLWILNIRSEYANGYQFIFDKFYIPMGCNLFIYNDAKDMILGSFTQRNNRKDGTFLTQYINGNSVFLEFFQPSECKEKATMNLSEVVYIYEDCFNRKGPFSQEGSGSCNINTICYQNLFIDIEVKSTAMILERTNGRYWGVCSGVLINKTNNYVSTDRPFFLTANHCYEIGAGKYSDTKDWLILFRHESLYCNSDGGELPYNTTKSVLGATIVSRNSGSKESDWLLLQLHNTLSEFGNYDIAFAGIAKGEEDALGSENYICIHHPNGDVKKISTTQNITSARWDGHIREEHWKVQWIEGVTAEGSSGSPLFNSAHQIVGILHGGKSYCEPTYDEYNKFIGDSNSPDLFGKISVSFDHGVFRNFLGFEDIYPFVPNLDSNIDLEIVEILPNIPTVTDDIYFNAKTISGYGKIDWTCLINKEPNDFGDYNDDAKREVKIIRNGGNSCKIGPIKRTKPGNYKMKLHIIDENNHQNILNYYFAVVESDGIVAAILPDDCFTNQVYEVQRGSRLKFYDRAYLTYSPTPATRYDGIYEIFWTRTVSNKEYPGRSYVANTIVGMEDTRYYNAYRFGDYSVCFDLQTEGEIIIGLNVWGGKMGYLLGQPRNPLNRVTTNYNLRVTKKLKVVDSSTSLNLNNLTYYDQSNRYGDIVLNRGAKVENGKHYDFIAYNKIVMKDGFLVRQGSGLHAKVVPPPPLIICDCDKPVIARFNGIDKLKDYNIKQPNIEKLSTGLMKIRIALDIKKVEIFKIEGSLIKVCNGKKNEIDISDLPSGVYLMVIHTKEGQFSHKFIKTE